MHLRATACRGLPEARWHSRLLAVPTRLRHTTVFSPREGMLVFCFALLVAAYNLAPSSTAAYDVIPCQPPHRAEATLWSAGTPEPARWQRAWTTAHMRTMLEGGIGSTSKGAGAGETADIIHYKLSFAQHPTTPPTPPTPSSISLSVSLSVCLAAPEQHDVRRQTIEHKRLLGVTRNVRMHTVVGCLRCLSATSCVLPSLPPCEGQRAPSEGHKSPEPSYPVFLFSVERPSSSLQ